MLRIYIIGLSILGIAILANGFIVRFNIKSWYDFIAILSKNGTSGFTKLSVLDSLWLFLIYPIILGFSYWVGDKIYSLFFN